MYSMFNQGPRMGNTDALIFLSLFQAQRRVNACREGWKDGLVARQSLSPKEDVDLFGGERLDPGKFREFTYLDSLTEGRSHRILTGNTLQIRELPSSDSLESDLSTIKFKGRDLTRDHSREVERLHLSELTFGHPMFTTAQFRTLVSELAARRRLFGVERTESEWFALRYTEKGLEYHFFRVNRKSYMTVSPTSNFSSAFGKVGVVYMRTDEEVDALLIKLYTLRRKCIEGAGALFESRGLSSLLLDLATGDLRDDDVRTASSDMSKLVHTCFEVGVTFHSTIVAKVGGDKTHYLRLGCLLDGYDDAEGRDMNPTQTFDDYLISEDLEVIDDDDPSPRPDTLFVARGDGEGGRFVPPSFVSFFSPCVSNTSQAMTVYGTDGERIIIPMAGGPNQVGRCYLM